MSALAYRPAEPEDLNFVRSAFLSGYKHAHAAGMISMADWQDVMGAQWDKIVARDDVSVFVAYYPGEDDRRFDLHGFIAVMDGYEVDDRPVPFIVYCYVKHLQRRLGIASGMLAYAGIDPSKPFHFAAKTSVITKLKKVLPLARWKPIAIRYPKESK